MITWILTILDLDNLYNYETQSKLSKSGNFKWFSLRNIKEVDKNWLLLS